MTTNDATTNDASVEAFIDQFASCWKTNDGTALADSYTVDGTLINPFGQRAEGREAVGAMYREYFAGLLQGTTTTVTLQTVRPIGTDHAFADAEQTITGPNGDPLLVVHLAAVLRRAHDTWQFVDARPYAITPAP